MEPVPTVFRQRGSSTQDTSAVYHRATKKVKNYSHSDSIIQTISEFPICLTCTLLDCGRMPKYPKENPLRHTVNMQTPHTRREIPQVKGRPSNLQPSRCEGPQIKRGRGGVEQILLLHSRLTIATLHSRGGVILLKVKYL